VGIVEGERKSFEQDPTASGGCLLSELFAVAGPSGICASAGITYPRIHLYTELPYAAFINETYDFYFH